MNRTFAAVLGALLAMTALTQHASAQELPTTFSVDGARVTQSGSGANSIILLPGLGSGAYAFDGMLPQLNARATVYALTFPGFDGVQPIAAPYLPAYERIVEDLIAHHHLVKPVIIGHSLGGHLAVKIAEDYPQQLGAVIALDALPLFPPSQPGASAADRAAYVTRIEAFMNAPMSDERYAASTKQAVDALVTSPNDAATILQHQMRGERATINGAAIEMMREDLGPRLDAIAGPLLVVAPVDPARSASSTRDYYSAAYTGAKTLSVVTVGPSRHFMMYDQPAQTNDAIATFLSAHNR
jgi:pimeloyl-ACP methyl ester carboxylesterase